MLRVIDVIQKLEAVRGLPTDDEIGKAVQAYMLEDVHRDLEALSG